MEEMGDEMRKRHTDNVSNALIITGILGKLFIKGVLLVRIAKIINVWVTTDSTNHPVRKSGMDAWKIKKSPIKVAISKNELIGPKVSINFLRNGILHFCGFSIDS